jgi:hypothetical protein
VESATNDGAWPGFSTEPYGVNITTPPSVFISTVPSRFGVTVIFPLPNTSRILGNELTSLACLFPFSGRSPVTSLKFIANKVGRPVPTVSSIGTFLFDSSLIFFAGTIICAPIFLCHLPILDISLIQLSAFPKMRVFS